MMLLYLPIAVGEELPSRPADKGLADQDNVAGVSCKTNSIKPKPSVMSIKFVRKTFDHWLQSNSNRFQRLPYIVESSKAGFGFRFAGVIPELHGYVSRRGTVSVWVYFQGEPWDMVFDVDISPRRNSQGQYYCNECVRAYEDGYMKETPVLYASRQELLVWHSFEPLLQWANEKLQDSYRLCLGGAKGDATWAFIKTEEDAIAGKWPYVLPILIGKE